MHDHHDGISRRAALQRLSALFAAGGLLGTGSTAWAAAPDVVPQWEVPNDRRLGPLQDLDGYFPFTVPESAEVWERRAEFVRRQILVACGLWPMPTKTPIEPVVHGKIDRGEYTVEKVYFESFPGLYVTGSLFRPKGHEGPRPAILCPHGHWANGRFYDAGEQGVKREIAAGAEKYEVGGRYPLQARCVHLARMGCTVFHYDMLGYADSVPISQALAHGFAKQREELSRPDRWGLFSAQAELRLINIMGLQTLNSIRALDWISGLPEVDTQRIGVTGASGGGTQTFMVAATDPRVAAAFPAVMVSTAMQGGCTCENASYLRVNTGNIELAALVAPRPLAMSAADDWTKELETKGLPELKEHYARLGAADNVTGKYFPFGHNYNAVSRQMMYEFFNAHFGLGQESPIEERDYQPLSIPELSVWDSEHPKPAMDEEAELALVRALDADSRRQMEALTPRDAESLKEYRRVVGGALEVMIGRGLPDARDIEWDRQEKTDRDRWIEFVGRLRYRAPGTVTSRPMVLSSPDEIVEAPKPGEKPEPPVFEELPVVFLQPKAWNRQVVVWIHEQGKSGLYGRDGEVSPEVRRLLDAGTAVASVDVLYTGEFLRDGQTLTRSRSVANPREFLGYTVGYNHPLFAQRVHDVLTTIAFCRSHASGPERIHLAGSGAAAAWVAAAAALAGDAVDKLALDTAGFRFATITDIRDVNLLPGAVKYGDLPGLLALAAPHPLWLGGEKTVPDVVAAAYKAAGAGDRLMSKDVPRGREAEAMAGWLT